MKQNSDSRPQVLIEERFPTDLLNEQVLREIGSTPFNAVHRWFSRKPLSFSRASVLGSLLPASTTMDEFKKLLGVPAITNHEYRLYQKTPSHDVVSQVHDICRKTWGDDFNVLDAFAGGGSIPFESVRYGIPTIACDLNPVAVTIMKAAIEVPLTTGIDLLEDLQYWVDWVGKEAEQLLQPYFTSVTGERVRDYLWAHTVPCPDCALVVPLSPTWWLDRSPSAQKTKRACAVRLIIPETAHEQYCSFEIVQGAIASGTIDGYNPDDNGTVVRKVGRCPRCKAILTQPYLCEAGQAGRLGFQMYAVSYHDYRGKLLFRVPAQNDLDAYEKAASRLQELEDGFRQDDLIPDELIPDDNTEAKRLPLYGLYRWRDLYAPRQLLTLTSLLQASRKAINLYGESFPERQTSLALWLAMILDRCVDKNSRLSSWHTSRVLVNLATTTHSLNLMWNFPEINGATRLWQMSADSVTGDYKSLCLQIGSPSHFDLERETRPLFTATIADAAMLSHIPNGSITTIVTDPPYYRSVPYAEIADMYYVWQKRVLAPFLPHLFLDTLTNKDMEAVASAGRFAGYSNPTELAAKDYELKLARAFSEYHRVLHEDGVLTVQFNHKDSGAWDILSQTLINAGFEITATWAVNTENPNSIHQAEKNAVNSTVLLVCRKRTNVSSAWWEDVQPQVREAVVKRVPQLEEMGMKGIDLYLAAFGPALQILSRNWPVRDRNNVEIRPETALAEARQAVVDERMAQMTEGRYIQLDAISRFYLVAWDCFLAREFSFDEARLLALSTGDIDIGVLRDRYRLISKKGRDVYFLTPRDRVHSNAVNVQASSYATMVDALHAALALYIDDGITAVQRFFDRTGLFANDDFRQFIELALKMIPPAAEEHKALTDLLLSDVKLRGAIQMPLFEGIDVQTHEQPRLF